MSYGDIIGSLLKVMTNKGGVQDLNIYPILLNLQMSVGGQLKNFFILSKRGSWR
ncbi:hypothetical protein SAMN05421755_106812 [Nitrosomonas sp. Nm33]|nr:hypothetical protein SAMN05421755_106812 [Nitrosomonas sp. Nm33]